VHPHVTASSHPVAPAPTTRDAKSAVAVASPPPPIQSTVTSEELRALALASGLERMGVRPPLRQYLSELWGRRAFTWELSRSKAYARNRNNYLGQAWSVLTPLLNAAVYVIIFGIILQTGRGLDNAIAFMVVGTFIFRFFEHSVTGGAKAIRGNTSLVRAIRFPRAVLPISVVLSELVTLGPALVVMVVVSYASGYFPDYAPVPVSWRWLLLPFAIVLLAVFNAGCAFIMARWVAVAPDVQNLIGFAMRFIMYGSGVIFSIQHFVGKYEALAKLLQHQPVAVFLDLCRACILNEPTIPMTWQIWAWAAAWALAFCVGGFIYFWRGEERYGRD
jgi:teichoic acid transport system permease protein